ncbi:MAG: YdcF family protein [Anaerolineales bacterium]|jgi:uncharacterized SAM-binding protein YcdF (DUF218 family)
MQNKKRRKWIFRILILAAAGLGLWLAALGIEVTNYARQTSQEPADAAVVLGAAVYRNRPSPVYRERINHAVDLFHQGQVRALIFTGGKGPGDAVSEGEAGREYALAAGVPESAIFIETTSENTLENLENAQEIIETQGFKSILLVSDPLHMRRAMFNADDLGLDAESSPTTTSRYRSLHTQMRFLLREVYYLAVYQILSV